MIGHGTLAGFNRNIVMPLSNMQSHSAPRIPGTTPQSFPTDMFLLQGQIIGDPDFDLLRITGGSGFGMPSPGHTTLTRLGPPGSNWNVDSFFDITYRIDFVGALVANSRVAAAALPGWPDLWLARRFPSQVPACCSFAVRWAWPCRTAGVVVDRRNNVSGSLAQALPAPRGKGLFR